MPTPQTTSQFNRYTADELLPVVRRYPDRFAFLGGGGTLNPMIQEALSAGRVSDALRQRFERTAESLIAKGAVGFGEMTAEHLSFNAKHPYVAAPPDHPLLLLLADIAARHDVPIDMHMEAVLEDMPLPPRFQSPPNPKRLTANVAALERLLAHNRRAKIIWVHLGWDSTGHRTVGMTRGLFDRHSNLYMSIRVASDFHAKTVREDTYPMTGDGRIKPEWLELVQDYPDRLLIGSDEFFMSPQGARTRHGSTGSTGKTADFLDQLPADLAKRIGSENPRRVFKLD